MVFCPPCLTCRCGFAPTSFPSSPTGCWSREDLRTQSRERSLTALGNLVRRFVSWLPPTPAVIVIWLWLCWPSAWDLTAEFIQVSVDIKLNGEHCESVFVIHRLQNKSSRFDASICRHSDVVYELLCELFRSSGTHRCRQHHRRKGKSVAISKASINKLKFSRLMHSQQSASGE